MATRPNPIISTFKSKLSGGGARPNLFQVEITSASVKGATDWDDDKFQFLCKAAALPGHNIASIDVPFRGRIFKVAGDRTIDTWTVTVINDEDFQYRTGFEAWMDRMAQLTNNEGAVDPEGYMSTAKVQQLGRGSTAGAQDSDGASNEQAVLKEYEFENIFPTNISAIDLSYDSGDTIEEFTVEFAVNNVKLL